MRRGAMSVEAAEKRRFQNRLRARNCMGRRIYVNYGTSILYGISAVLGNSCNRKGMVDSAAAK